MQNVRKTIDVDDLATTIGSRNCNFHPDKNLFYREVVS